MAAAVAKARRAPGEKELGMRCSDWYTYSGLGFRVEGKKKGRREKEERRDEHWARRSWECAAPTGMHIRGLGFGV